MTRRRIRLIALDTAAMARRRAPRADLALRMQGVALVGVFLRVSPFAAAAGYDRERLLSEVRMRLGRFYGKRGSSVIDANLDIIAEAYDTAIDVTAALASAGSHADAA
jgi:pyruvate-ferredoxin/flavodoxin oxidoreductase